MTARDFSVSDTPVSMSGAQEQRIHPLITAEKKGGMSGANLGRGAVIIW